MARILVIDDEISICKLLTALFSRSGHEVASFLSLRAGVEEVERGDFDVVFLDVHFPEGNGLNQLPRIVASPSEPEVIIITGLGEADGAALAMQCGAWDYVQKQASMKGLELALKRALQFREGKIRQKARITLKREEIVGDSQSIRQGLDKLSVAAHSESPVLLWGETGTGKDLFARAVHRNSARAEGPFVVVDCAAMPDTLVESILFGHARGAFTGADAKTEGLVSQANGGTLFLDEVGELPLEVQASFLRLLDQKSFYPVGASQPRTSDFRLVSATNRSLEEMKDAGSFRSDLYYRISASRIDLPPLREREGDIEAIVFNFLRKQSLAGNAKGMVPEFVEALQRHDWPGNVRELLNTLQFAVEAAGEMTVLFPAHLPTALLTGVAIKEFEPNTVSPNVQSTSPHNIPIQETWAQEPLRAYRRRGDIAYLRNLLSQCDGDMQEAVHISGMSRPRLYALLKEYGISPRR